MPVAKPFLCDFQLSLEIFTRTGFVGPSPFPHSLYPAARTQNSALFSGYGVFLSYCMEPLGWGRRISGANEEWVSLWGAFVKDSDR